MINLDHNYEKERQKIQFQQNTLKREQIDVSKSINSALKMMKQNINKNSHLQETLRKHSLSQNKSINNHKFSIEQIYSNNNNHKSSLKHTIPLIQLNLQRSRIRNTFKTFQINTDYDFNEEKIDNHNNIAQSFNQNQLIQQQQSQQNLKHKRKLLHDTSNNNQYKSIIPIHPHSATAGNNHHHHQLQQQQQNNFFITNPQLQQNERQSKNSIRILSKDKQKQQITQLSETQYITPQNSYINNNNNTINGQQQLSNKNITILNNESIQTTATITPFIQRLSTSTTTHSNNNNNIINFKSMNQRSSSNFTHFTNQNNPTQNINTNQNNELENNSLLTNKNLLYLSSSIISNSNYLSPPQYSTLNQYKSQPISPSQTIQSENTHPNQFNKDNARLSLNQQRDTNLTIQFDEEMQDKNNNNNNHYEDNIQEQNIECNEQQQRNNNNKIIDDTYQIQPKQFYYINNNEMQSVQEFMYRVHKYEQYKRFEQQKAEKHKRQQQINEVQQLLLFRSEKAAKEVAKANIRKYIMKHKITVSDEEIDEWVEKIKVLPLERNQRLTFRECNRQIISFQLMGSDEEKQFFQIQREIDKALNKINRPVKFIQQYQIYLNNKAKNFQNISPTSNQISMALINQLPSQYLINVPPSSFFQQNSQSINKISSSMNIKVNHRESHNIVQQEQVVEEEIEQQKDDMY